MLVDDVTITVKAGDGGNGAVSFLRNAQTIKGGPDGGNGGNGANVYIEGIHDISALSQFRYKKEIHAENGISGRKRNLFGRKGQDAIIQVPVGTRVTDLSTNRIYEIEKPHNQILIARGGKGGRGNNEFKTATNQTPTFAEKGEQGEEKKLRLELLLIADVGLIGLPNAGKSSLLASLTNAHPKIGNYPFTTLEPNLGVFEGIILADIPGLIEGASRGKGLGIAFLKHIQKTKLLLHCIDATSQDVLKDYQTVRHEFENYNKELLNKKEIILLTKKDLVAKNVMKKHIQKLKRFKKEIIPVSIVDDMSLSALEEKIKTSAN